jgi:hypothetical protein
VQSLPDLNRPPNLSGHSLPVGIVSLSPDVHVHSAKQGVISRFIATSPITAFETPTHEFDELLEPYTSLFAKPLQPHVELPSIDLLVEAKEHAHSASAAPAKPVKDEWEGLF